MQRAHLLIANDVAAEAEDEFNRWYENQHLDERLGVPGFLNARRYLAQAASSKYVACYEAQSTEVFTSAAYRARLAEPTEWTQRVMPAFRRMHRTVMREAFRSVRGLGALLDLIVLDGADTAPSATYARAAADLARDAAFEGLLVLSAVNQASASGTPEGNLRPGPDATMAHVALVWWADLPGHAPSDARGALAEAGLACDRDAGGRYRLITARGRIDLS